MKFYLTLAAVLLVGCGSAPPKSAPPSPVVIPKPPTTNTDPSIDSPQVVVPAKPRLQIAIGDQTACLRLDSSLRCWERATGSQVPHLMALAPITGIGDVTDVSVGMNHVCALNRAGQVFCWGDNSNGQLGARRAEEKIPTPVRALGIEGATAIACGMMHSCAILGDGRVTCWGWNAEGQTGSDTEYSREARELIEPEIVAGISDAVAIAAGRDQTCVKTKTGTSCWGRSYLKSQSKTRGYHSNVPAQFVELADLVQLTLKDETACGLFKDGHVGCWGSGVFSLLPNRPLQAEEPLPLILPAAARSFAAGEYHGCAMLQNGRVACFGMNNNGELGRAPEPDYQPHETQIVEGLPGHIDSLSVGSASSCAIVHRDELWCWGIAPHLPWVHGAGSGTPARVAIEP